MFVLRSACILLAAITTGMGTPSFAQTTAGSGTAVVLPLATNIPGAYNTTVFVRNPSTNPAITVAVYYFQSDSAHPPGNGSSLSCNPLSLTPGQVVSFDLAAQCSFTGPLVDNFGQIVLLDVTSTYKTHPFFAYSRTEAPTGNGFSVEGFPIGNFSAAQADSLGLKQTTAAPHYKSNCFIGAMGEAVNYQLILRQGETGAIIGTNSVSGTLAPYHNIRILDVFGPTGANAAPGDYSNVRATFTNSANSAMIAFCTLETTDNGSADFRIAKSENANDNRQSRLACYGMDDCNANVPSVSNPAQITDITKKNIHYTIFNQPDFIKCDLVSSQLNHLQVTLRGPGNPITSPTFVLNPPFDSPPYTSGGAGQTGFYIYTGEKSAIGSGSTTRWYIDVSYFAGSGSPTLPINYGIKCSSGNGITVPWLGTTAPAT